MADPVNNFGPITPEQEEMIRRQRVEEVDLLGLLPLLAGGGFGAIGYNIARSGLPRVPSALLGGNLGAGAADITQRSIDRHQNTIRDAEGQPGGFYGKSREQLVRELMK